ncbi:polysaccharide lyase family 7 protein [Vibrio sp. 10N.261.51.F12]|uniref:polysaccharide lyase family 7 protein n=1 Tax=Vibrio sp. 10N.261.51.F12 TaxID=3229679 RepID=UPI0035526F50
MTIKKSTTLGLIGSICIAGNAYAQLDMNDASENRGIPAEYSQFQSILAVSKLQISEPHGKKGNQIQVAEDSNFSNIVNQYFYVDKESEAFVFKMFGDHRRAELRVHENFRSDLPNTFYRLSASFKPVAPQESMKDSDITQNEITYLQVHNKGMNDNGDGGIPHPLLRVVWKQDANGVMGHYWAIIKANSLICKGERGADNIGKDACKPQKAYKHYDLGIASEENDTAFDVIVGNQKLVINVDGKQQVDHDISYWKPLLSYYKAGVYNQFSNGESHAEFSKLEYSVDQIK